MMQKKVCMLGGFAVGKTSLVRRYVTNVFSEHYQTTIGVTVEKKMVTVDRQDMMLMLWDLYGEDEFQSIRESYLRGSSGYILVVDGTRRATLDTAESLQHMAASALGPVPFFLIVNKLDLRSEWEVDEDTLSRLRRQGWLILLSSAKTGQGVEELFTQLASKMVQAA